MIDFKKKGIPVIGIMFFAVGLLKLVQGGNWVVWMILGALFGGLGIFNRRPDGSEKP